ncbi:hypothetical protein B0H15DRAFT_926043 [Mycena belliarum]|uniref:CxC5 like cysteine cluster associated with KDZ domain-containing protein n=1 Tax=Mycena belliarum TaxID=1033014 RepID=A0AAD6TLJ0_9AGAR|nr:hypothetical protein B0H15DRAFT_926043 [Mycena belliae]
MASVRDLILILQLFFPPDLALEQGIYVLVTIISLYPVFRLHVNQGREPRQPGRTGWFKSLTALLRLAFSEDAGDIEAWTTGLGDDDRVEACTEDICSGLDQLYMMLGLHGGPPSSLSTFQFRTSKPILSTSRLNCMFCPAGDSNLIPTLRRRRADKIQTIKLLDSSFHWVEGSLLVAHCASCSADYYPDRVTYKEPGSSGRSERLEYDAQVLRVSKHGIWVDRRIAVAQEKALSRFRSGWSNWADWINDYSEDSQNKLTHRQSQRLFLEHFSRRLLLAHRKEQQFHCEAHPSASVLAEKVRNVIGVNGGVLPASMSHGCQNCTHVKRFRSDLIDEGAVLGGNTEVADSSEAEAIPNPTDTDAPPPIQGLPRDIPAALPQLAAPPAGSPRGYIRMAVTDLKTIKHRKCALDDCQGPLVNYKNGRFCDTHLDLRNSCGIIPCGLPIHQPGALTCNTPSHIAWQKMYDNRFSRLSFPGVQRVIRRQQSAAEDGSAQQRQGPSLRVQLQALGNVPGDQVVHTFKAKAIYGLQTFQWACGTPIGWGKCYRSESEPQVLAIMNRIWLDFPESRPGFLAYDSACDLLRHIVTQNPEDLWLKSTKFIVDAWHYIGHRATDLLCRTRCNPAPLDGSQPDLILTVQDDNGQVHQTRAFNTETAEQLNSWLSGFEAALQQMTDVNYDFYVHVLMMIYGETLERKIEEKGWDLSDEFWVAVNDVLR